MKCGEFEDISEKMSKKVLITRLNHFEGVEAGGEIKYCIKNCTGQRGRANLEVFHHFLAES